MAIARVQMPDGRIARIEVPDGTSPEDVEAFVTNLMQQQSAPEQAPAEEPVAGIGPQNPGAGIMGAIQNAGKAITGGAEVAATLASGAFAEPVAGLAGIAAQAVPGGRTGTEAIGDVREALTFQPRTQEGQQQLQAVGEFVEPLATKMKEIETGLGDAAFEKTGSPALAAAATAAPTALLELLGAAVARGGAKTAQRARDIAKAVPDERVSSILATAKKADVPVLTTDIFPPEGFLGKTLRNISEKLGPLGTGGKRVDQQRARIEAAAGIADNIDIDSPFASDIVRSLNKSSAARMKTAGRVRNEAVSALDEFGEFPAPRSMEAIDRLLAKQERLGQTANSTITTELTAFREELLKSSDFSLKKDLRSQLIKKVKAAGRAEDVSPAAALQQVKSALDKDMVAFARTKDRTATQKWLASNRKFANELEVTRRTELKRILDAGEATPEKIVPILRGGKPTELKRLHDSLGPNGRVSAKKALLQQALKDAGYFKVDAAPNPDAIATALNRPQFQQAFKVFFGGRDKVELDGLTRLLDATREAQRSQAMVQTGQQLLVPGLAVGATGAVASGAVSPGVALGVAGTASAVLRAYESAAFRNLLIKIRSAKKGAPIPPRLLDAANTALVSAAQSIKETQEDTE